MYYMYINDVLFPVTPSKLSLKISNKNKPVSLINEGEVNYIKTPGLTDITIDDLLLPMVKYPFAVYPNNKFHRADWYLKKLESWKCDKKPVTFIMSRTSPDGSKLLFDTNMSVTIEEYEIIEDASQGLDVKVKLTMKQYKEWGAKKLVVKKSTTKKKTVVKKSTTRKTKSPAKTYTVKSGDCLWNIAKKQLGNANRWKEIYNLNKSVIESTAKKHGYKSSSNGHWIFPGTKLTLPS